MATCPSCNGVIDYLLVEDARIYTAKSHLKPNPDNVDELIYAEQEGSLEAWVKFKCPICDAALFLDPESEAVTSFLKR